MAPDSTIERSPLLFPSLDHVDVMWRSREGRTVSVCLRMYQTLNVLSIYKPSGLYEGNEHLAEALKKHDTAPLNV